MENKKFTLDDIRSHLHEHPNYEKISGTYVLSMGSLTKDEVQFHVTDHAFQIFIEQIIHAIVELSSVKASTAPIEWAAAPGKDREAILRRYQETPEVYAELLRENPNIVLIHKTSDEGKEVSWEVSS